MYSKQHKIDSIVEDLIQDLVIESFTSYLDNAKECDYALEVLKTKLEEFDTIIFKRFFD